MLKRIDIPLVFATTSVVAVVCAVLIVGDHSGSARVDVPAQSIVDRATQNIAYYTAMLAWFTAALAAASVAQGFFLVRADKTARAAANAAQASVDLARETAQMQLRAYVYIDALEIRNFGTERPLEAWLMLKNSGNTPAYNFQRLGHIALGEFPLRTFATVIWGNIKGFLAPNGEVYFGPLRTQKALTADEYASVVAGTHAIYVWGNLRYTDAFKRERYVQFRSYYRGNGVPVVGTVATQQDTDGNGSN